MITKRNRNRININTVCILGLTAVSIIHSCNGDNSNTKIDTLRADIDRLEKKLEQKEIIVKDKKDLVDAALIDAMITIESSNNPDAYNKHTGAVGLMQLTPVIYKKLCGITKEEAFQPDKNVACGTLFMRHLLNKYNSNIERALLHYNNGHVIRNKKYSKKVLKEKNK